MLIEGASYGASRHGTKILVRNARPGDGRIYGGGKKVVYEGRSGKICWSAILPHRLFIEAPGNG